MRHRILASGLLLLVAAVPARADAPVFNWSGFYVGGHAGYGWGMTDHGAVGFDTDGALAGGQIGVNRQIGNFVFGLEGALSWSGMRGHLAASNYFGQASVDFPSRVDWLASVTGRLGVAQGASLVYVKGGVAWAGTQHGMHLTYTGPAPAPFDTIDRTGSVTHAGWALGGGIEHAFAPNWSARIEYAHVALPRRPVSITGPTSTGGVVTTVTSELDVLQSLHLVKLGVNYHFGGPATLPMVVPVPASGRDWSGFYLGLHAGYGAGRATWLDFDHSQHVDYSGGLAGGQAGLNIQVGRVVFGAELEAAWGSVDGEIRGTVFDGGLGPTSLALSSRMDWLGVAAGRIGVTYGDWLLFVKAGAAAASFRHVYEQVAPGLLAVRTDGRHHHAGILIDAGLEFAISRHWSIKAEYDFIDFGRELVTVSGTASGAVFNGTVIADQTIRQQLHLAKLGVNYRFAPP